MVGFNSILLFCFWLTFIFIDWLPLLSHLHSLNIITNDAIIHLADRETASNASACSYPFKHLSTFCQAHSSSISTSLSLQVMSGQNKWTLHFFASHLKKQPSLITIATLWLALRSCWSGTSPFLLWPVSMLSAHSFFYKRSYLNRNYFWCHKYKSMVSCTIIVMSFYIHIWAQLLALCRMEES